MSNKNNKILSDINRLLQPFVPLVAQSTGKDITLERMYPLLKLIGDPHKKLRVIHVAGTSGKTSTCYYMRALLQASGKKTGLTVSPHIDGVNERVQIHGKPLTPTEFHGKLLQFLHSIENLSEPPSYFELMLAFALWVFDKEKVDYAIVETGMGGLFDASNVVTRPDKVCVITDIGFDHMNILGHTLPEISAQKAGIIHENNQVFIHQQSADILSIVQRRVDEKQATLKTLKNDCNNTPGIPHFQNHNWQLALATVNYIADRDDFTIKPVKPADINIPARMQIYSVNGVEILMDGAHNEQKTKAFVESFQNCYPRQTATVLLALKRGKEYRAVVDALKPIADEIIASTFYTSQDLPAKSQDPTVIADYCRNQEIKVVEEPNIQAALDKLLSNQNAHKVVTGSFYFIGQVRKFL